MANAATYMIKLARGIWLKYSPMKLVLYFEKEKRSVKNFEFLVIFHLIPHCSCKFSLA